MSYLPDYIDGALAQTRTERIKELLSLRYDHPPLAYVHSFGCQQNVSDGEHLCGLLASLGFGFCPDSAGADLVLFNTCAVRENAEERVFGNIGALSHLKRARPDMIIAVCGCMTQQEAVRERLRKSYPYVDLAFGANAAHRLPELLLRLLEERRRVIDGREPGEKIVENLPVRREGKVRAWLPIMQGCDNFCTYCIVPYVRGREHSRAMPDVLREAKELIAEGYKEITLLGQNVNSYGKGLEGEVTFPRLLRELNDLPGDFWIRFMTSHPKDCTKELIDAIAECGKVCNYIHLPVQCGSDEILRRMNRRYTAAQYKELVEYARERIPGVSFSSDIMVGFPGERYEDFLQTLELVKEVRFHALYTFLYSKRGGTAAAQLPDPVPAQEKSRWFRQLLAAQEQITRSFHEQMVGRTLRVLCEGPGKEQGMMSGRTESGVIAQFAGDEALAGQFLQVKITRALNWAVCGEMIE
ncbi:tRNA (N6-isopentenyl adenosine(37)-C2)-methylthiotransferase MiaB [Provencibacterium massiliense]|uniref:tRNA (N6-isopentenyl adenosine(37)-C2)-methylthiotransferase MiaB n=1 Tax=Provencibacterium massiliense TaxID=1841868 RepID=UPI0009A631BA|nr:tRNA (N6-isopentenyl adenosine(37)-C2)-methylthiotransferase MiaB [Provencibacterium massiliense]